MGACTDHHTISDDGVWLHQCRPYGGGAYSNSDVYCIAYLATHINIDVNVNDHAYSDRNSAAATYEYTYTATDCNAIKHTNAGA